MASADNSRAVFSKKSLFKTGYVSKIFNTKYSREKRYKDNFINVRALLKNLKQQVFQRQSVFGYGKIYRTNKVVSIIFWGEGVVKMIGR